MNKHPVDIAAMLAYVSGGGLSAVGGFLAVVDPGHSAIWLASGAALIACAGLARALFNPTPPPGTTAVVSSTTPPTPASLETVPKGPTA